MARAAEALRRLAEGRGRRRRGRGGEAEAAEEAARCAGGGPRRGAAARTGGDGRRAGSGEGDRGRGRRPTRRCAGPRSASRRRAAPRTGRDRVGDGALDGEVAVEPRHLECAPRLETGGASTNERRSASVDRASISTPSVVESMNRTPLEVDDEALRRRARRPRAAPPAPRRRCRGRARRRGARRAPSRSPTPRDGTSRSPSGRASTRARSRCPSLRSGGRFERVPGSEPTAGDSTHGRFVALGRRRGLER